MAIWRTTLLSKLIINLLIWLSVIILFIIVSIRKQRRIKTYTQMPSFVPQTGWYICYCTTFPTFQSGRNQSGKITDLCWQFSCRQFRDVYCQTPWDLPVKGTVCSCFWLKWGLQQVPLAPVPRTDLIPHGSFTTTAIGGLRNEEGRQQAHPLWEFCLREFFQGLSSVLLYPHS